MGLDIVTNTMATEASNDISTNESNMQSSLEKLSSGYQINSPADDASGYVISQHLQAQIGGFQQAQANTQAGINVVQTADGALNEVSSILQRINTLAVQSANTSATDLTAQQAAQSEVNQALTSIGDIAQTTVYGNEQLLVNGTASTVNFTFQVGNDNTSSSQVTFSVTALNLANLGLVTDSLDLDSAGATAAGISGITASGAAMNQLFTVTTVAAGSGSPATAAEISITSGTYSTTVSLTTAQNVSGGLVALSLSNGLNFTVDLSGALAATSFLATADYNGGKDLNDVNFSITSSTAVQTISNAIDAVSSIGGTLGAVQNELTDVSDNESVMIQNLQSSNAQIMDTNMASQMVTFTQDQTLVQAGVSMLAQANQIPQYVLKLLG